MKMDIVAGSQNDEFWTPEYAVTPILKYIPASRVWCPFDTPQSRICLGLVGRGCDVIPTHISSGGDFFESAPPDGAQYIASNPPYSRKGDVLERLFGIGLPFAMLVGVVGLFESQRRFRMFRDNPFEIMYLNKRVSYMRGPDAVKPELNPPFSSVWLCSRVLPERIVFEEIAK